MKSPIRLIALAIVPSLVVIAIIPLFLTAVPAPQKIETVDGVRIVHNQKGGVWGEAPKIALELVRKIGDVDTEDEHLAFNYPSDVTVDHDGNIYVLDSANTRIQKFGPDGKYQATIGRKGQGPGEFLMPDAIAFDKITGHGRLVTSIVGQGRSQAALMQSLRGNASFSFNDGQIKGVNLAAIARSIQSALSGQAAGPGAATD